MLTLYTVEAENALEHYQHHAIHVLGWEVRLDRSSPPATAYPPSSRLNFAKWEANASSLRSHFRALCSKIVDIYFRKFISTPTCTSDGSLRPFAVKGSNPDALTGSGFIEFRDLETAAEALTGFEALGLSLAYARPRDRSRSGRALRGDAVTGSGFGLKKGS